MTNKQEPKGKIHFSKQAFDTLANADQELGEKLGGALRDIMQNPTQESPIRRRSTRNIREEDLPEIQKTIGQRVVGWYHEISAHAPFVPDTFYIAMLFTIDKHIFLSGVSEEDLKRLGYPKSDPTNTEERYDVNEKLRYAFHGIHEVDGGISLQLKTEDGKIEGVFASHYALMQRLDDDDTEEERVPVDF